MSPLSADDEPGFGVYVHWPFCAQKCPYCDFNSHVRHGGWDEARFLGAYLSELDYVAEHTDKRMVTSIFFGGGTPSLMRAATVGTIIERIGELWPVAADAEITLEANPGSVEAARFAGYRAAGVSRVSIGVQSLRDEALKALGRIHTVAEARSAIEIAQATFARTSFDLIYARPGQTEPEWRTELGEALAIAGEHLSLYQLTIEPETTYARLYAAGKLSIPDGEAASRLYEATAELTDAAGLPAYEISNYARPGAGSRHNLLYWRYGPYAGIGPGAHGRLIRSGARTATETLKSPEAWLAQVEHCGHGLASETVLARQEIADELLVMGLRISEGLDVARLAQLAGVAPAAESVRQLAGLGLLVESEDRRRLIATARGRMVLDAVIRALAETLVSIETPVGNHS